MDMSSYRKTGALRSITAVTFAIFAVAMMLAAPVLTSIDSDADFKGDKAGYSITMINPTDEEIEKYDTGSKAVNIAEAAYTFMYLFNTSIFNTPEATSGSYKYVEANGENIEARTTNDFYVYEVSADSVRMTYTAAKAGSLIDDNAIENEYSEKVAEALKEYLGNEVGVGDKLTLTGKVSAQIAYNEEMDYASVDSSHSVRTKGLETIYHVYSIDATIGFVKAGSGAGSTVSFKSDLRFMGYYDLTYDYYGVKYSDLKEGSPCKLTFGDQHTSFLRGNSTYTIGEKDYPIYVITTDGYTEETETDIEKDSEVNLNLINEYIETIPDSSGNVTVGKTYKDAEAPYDNVLMQVVVEEVLDVFLILAIVVGVVFVLILIFIVIHIRKKSQ